MPTNWDICYMKTGAPVALDNAPTADSGADDPRTLTTPNAPFVISDKYGRDQSPELMLFAVGGSPTVNVYVYSEMAKTWIRYATGLLPTPTVTVFVPIPVDALVFIQVTSSGTATGVFAGVIPTS